MRTRYLIHFILGIIFFGACTPDESIQPKKEYQPRLWRKSFFKSIQDSIPGYSDYYLYDSLNRVVKVWPGINILADSVESSVYYQFKYIKNDQLEYKLGYYESSKDKWEIGDSTHFLYENDLLVKEEICFPTIQGIPHIFIYEYESNLLVRKLYSEGLFKYLIKYEYEDTVCIKETKYSDPEGTIMSSYSFHIYSNEKKIRSELYSAKYNKIIQVINYTYNDDSQLIVEESIVDPYYQIPHPYVFRYEYEKVPK
jgi:hypothetical protein